MASRILTFPAQLFAENPPALHEPSPSAEEAVLNRPHRGLHLVGPRPIPIARANRPVNYAAQFRSVLSHIDCEVAHAASRLRLNRFFTPPSVA
jgi:hypothetical protein